MDIVAAQSVVWDPFFEVVADQIKIICREKGFASPSAIVSAIRDIRPYETSEGPEVLFDSFSAYFSTHGQHIVEFSKEYVRINVGGILVFVGRSPNGVNAEEISRKLDQEESEHKLNDSILKGQDYLSDSDSATSKEVTTKPREQETPDTSPGEPEKQVPEFVQVGENADPPLPPGISAPVAGGTPNPEPAKKPRPRPNPLDSDSNAYLMNGSAITGAKGDKLGFGEAAETIASYINAEITETPLVLAVNAPWGAGKSSLVNLILERLERRPLSVQAAAWANFLFGLILVQVTPTKTNERFSKFLAWCSKVRAFRFISNTIEKPPARPDFLDHNVLRFDAWMYDDAPKIGSAFTKLVLRQADTSRSVFWQILRPIPLKQSSWVSKVGLLGISVGVGYVANLYYIQFYNHSPVFNKFITDLLTYVAELTKTTKPDKNAPADQLHAVPTLLTLVTVLGKLKGATFDKVSKYISDPEKAADDATLARVNEKLKGLFRQATNKRRRFIIYIDNLERCKPENALSILEVVNQLMNHPQVVTIIAADMELIAASAGTRYKEQAKLLAKSEGSEAGICLEFGRRYVKKMVQTTVTVPRASIDGLEKLGGSREIR